jgi:hypothetical protein
MAARLLPGIMRRDSAIVRALRDAGAVILGKPVTTEMGGAFPGPTTNPFDPGRTPVAGAGAAPGVHMRSNDRELSAATASGLSAQMAEPHFAGIRRQHAGQQVE